MGYYDVDKSSPAPASHTPAQPGYGSVSEYQVSPLPWCTGSVASSTSVAQEYRLPFVSKRLTIVNHSTAGGLKVGFTEAGVKGSNFVLVDPVVGAKLELDTRVSVFYVLGVTGASTYSIFAGLTAIPSKYAPVLTGSVSGTNGSWQGIG